MSYATAIAPAGLSFLGVAREAAVTPGTTLTAVAPVATIPVDGDTYEPEDTPVFIHDDAIRDVMSGLFGDTLGPEDATFSYGGPFYADSWGYWLDNVLGDLSTTSAGTLGTARALAAPLAIGATSLTVSVSLGAVTTGSIIQIADGAASEVVVATSGSTGTTVAFTGSPCRFAHTVSATAALQTAATTYTHTFAQLNSGSGQPPTHTLTDYTGLTVTTGARAYASSVVASLALSADTSGLVTGKVAGFSYLSAPAAGTPTAGTSFTQPLAGWRSAVTIGGVPVTTTGSWSVTFARQMVIYWPPNSLAPWMLTRGPLAVTGDLAYIAPADESPLTNMLTGAPLSLSIATSNGLAGAGALSVTVAAAAAQFVKAKLSRASVITGYQDTWEAVANTTSTGGSGGAGPATVTLVNATPSY